MPTYLTQRTLLARSDDALAVVNLWQVEWRGASDFPRQRRIPSADPPSPAAVHGRTAGSTAGTWGIVRPGLVASGVGLASGEFVLWPYVASQVGVGLLWGAVAGVAIQWLLNLEIEHYTLAAGETALTGFSRLWRPAGLLFVGRGLRQCLAWMGDEFGDAAHVPPRRAGHGDRRGPARVGPGRC